MSEAAVAPQGFGSHVRHFRRCARDRTTPSGRLTLEKFAEYIGQELGTSYPSVQTVANWEAGHTTILSGERRTLVAIVKVLFTHGGLVSLAEADQLLAAGYYSNLEPDEQAWVFGVVQTPQAESGSSPGAGSAQADVLQIGFRRAVRRAIAFRRRMGQVAQGTPPAWPRLVVWLLRSVTVQVSPGGVLRALWWLGLWAGHWYFTEPFFRWPFLDRPTMVSAVWQYLGASLAIPLLIALALNPRANPAWQARRARLGRVRLFIGLGASLGYHIGFMGLYWAKLIGTAAGIAPLPLLAQLGAALPVAMGVWSAHLLADNLWRAYGHLSLRANWSLFVFPGFGFVWACLFVWFNDAFPDPRWQLLLWAIALFLIALQAEWARRRA